MTIDSYQKTKRIIGAIGKEIRYWDSYIDEFLANYIKLNLDEKILLNKETPSSVRYALMRQYTGHFRRNHDKSTQAELKEMIKNTILLIGLDNSEYDYRETIRDVGGFFINVEKSAKKEIVDKVWSEVKDNLSKEAKEKLESIIQGLEFNEQEKGGRPQRNQRGQI